MLWVIWDYTQIFVRLGKGMVGSTLPGHQECCLSMLWSGRGRQLPYTTGSEQRISMSRIKQILQAGPRS